MSSEYEWKVWGSDRYRIRLCWMKDKRTDVPQRAVMFAWQDKNGKFSRGVQKAINVEALIRMFIYARQHGWISNADLRDAEAEIASGVNNI